MVAYIVANDDVGVQFPLPAPRMDGLAASAQVRFDSVPSCETDLRLVHRVVVMSPNGSEADSA